MKKRFLILMGPFLVKLRFFKKKHIYDDFNKETSYFRTFYAPSDEVEVNCL